WPAAMASANRVLLSSSVWRANLSAASLRRRSANGATRTRVKSDTIVMTTRAPFTRSIIGTAASPKWPMLNVVAQRTAKEVTNAGAMANRGGERAASHSKGGNATTSGSNESQDPVGWSTAYILIKVRRASMAIPSTDSAREGNWRHT